MDFLYDDVKALLCAINPGSYGAAVVPATAIRAYNLAMTIEGRVLEDDQVQAYMGAGDHHIINKHVGVSFDVRAVGSGTAGTPPAFGPLLRMGGCREVVTAGTSVRYEPISRGFEDGGLHFFVDGERRAIMGARCNVSFHVARDDVPYFRFDLKGLYTAPTAATMPATDWSSWEDAIPAEPGNTTFDLHGHQPMLVSMSATLGQQVEYVSRVNDARVDVTARKATGTVTIDKPLLADKDYEANWRTKVQQPLTVVHGVEAGNIVEVGAPLAGITGAPREGVSEGRVTQELALTLKPASGNDEWYAEFR